MKVRLTIPCVRVLKTHTIGVLSKDTERMIQVEFTPEQIKRSILIMSQNTLPVPNLSVGDLHVAGPTESSHLHMARAILNELNISNRIAKPTVLLRELCENILQDSTNPN